MKAYYLIDTNIWRIIQINSTMNKGDVAAKNQGYMHSNSTLRWYEDDEIRHLPLDWTLTPETLGD
jgi:hypothetical protein